VVCKSQNLYIPPSIHITGSDFLKPTGFSALILTRIHMQTSDNCFFTHFCVLQCVSLRHKNKTVSCLSMTTLVEFITLSRIPSSRVGWASSLHIEPQWTSNNNLSIFYFPSSPPFDQSCTVSTPAITIHRQHISRPVSSQFGGMMAGCVVNGSMVVGLASGDERLDNPAGSVVATATV